MSDSPVSLQDLLAHQGWALRVARRLVHEEGEAEELVQRTWIAALRRPPEEPGASRAWIRKVILNLARERHRRLQARERHERRQLPEATSPDASESASRAEIQRALSERLHELAEPYRHVVVLRYYHGLSSAEIARRLGIPAGTARWRLKVGLDLLRADLDRRSGGDRSRWVSALLAFLPPDEVPEPAPDRAPEPAVTPGTLAAGPSPALGVLFLGGILAGGIAWLAFSARIGSKGREPAAEASLASGPETGEGAHERLGGGRAPLMAQLPALAPAAAREEDLGLRLVVVDEAGRPQAGARVLVASANGFDERARSDEHGRAWLVPRPEDLGALGLAATRERVSVRALAPGRAASLLFHVAPPFAPEHEVRLVVGGPEESLSGLVRDDLGRPLAGALVAWFDPGGKAEEAEGDFSSPSYLAAVTGPDGRFRIEHLPAERGHLGCIARGFALYSQPLDPREEGSIELRLSRGATLAGVVRRADGTPAVGARIACEPLLKAEEWAMGLPGYDPRWRGFGEVTTSDAQGRYRLEGVTAWLPRKVWALDPESGQAASLECRLRSGREERWDAQLSELGGYRLRLVDEAGRPLPRWIAHLRRSIEADRWWVRRLAADEEGRILVPDAPAGEALLDVFPPDDLGASWAWRRLRPGPEEQEIVVDTGATSSIQGRVLDDAGRADRRGLLVVHALETTLATRIGRDEEGRFEQRLVPGTYVLTLQLEQTATRLAEFTLEAGERELLGDLVAPALGYLRLDGTALFNGGPRPPSYSIFRLSDDERVRGVLGVGNGPFAGEVLIPAFPGRYRVLGFDSAGAGPDRREVLVSAHAETRIELGR